MEIAYPCLALVFLSPLNEFLRQVGHEPKFILTLLGRTGSMKSTASALSISAPKITLDMEDCSLNELLLQGNVLDAALDRFYFAILDGNFNSGNLSVQVPASLSQYNLDVQGAGGSFILNGEKQSLPYKADANTSSRPGKIHIVGGSATISLTVFE